MKTGSTVGPLSVIMKGEVVAPDSYWEGNPAYPAVVQDQQLSQQTIPENEWSV
jgi:hypothetical protein